MADEKPQKKGGKLKWFLLIFFIVLLGGGGTGAWYYFFSGLPGSKHAAESGPTTVKVVSNAPAKVLQTAALEPFLVNLADPLGKRYIKLVIEAELASPEVAEEINRQRPKIRDGIILLLSSKTYADLASAENKLTLQNEIVSRLNQILGGPKITRVFFTDLVIQ